MSGMSLWEEILWGWIVFTIAPKLLIIPVWKWMWQAMRDSERQDEIDRLWLEGLQGGDGGGNDRHPRERRPWMPGPRRGPRGGGVAVRTVERRPQKVAAVARRAPQSVPAR